MLGNPEHRGCRDVRWLFREELSLVACFIASFKCYRFILYIEL